MRFQSLYTEVFKATHQTGGEAPLDEVINKFPYFSLAHFFKLQQTDAHSEHYPLIAAKTALHFNNPFLLNEHLHTTPVVESCNASAAGRDQPENNFPVPIIEMQQDEKIATAEGIEVKDVDLSKHITPLSTAEMIFTENAPVLPSADEVIIEEDKAEITQELNEPPIAKTDLINDSPANSNLQDNKPLQAEAPLFEPLSASDYFASQGIKLSEEQIPADRMGKQLKSFTEWLKTMKKVHDNKLTATDTPVDLNVQHLAEKSNKEEEVLTEAMAEVYLQQGKTNKAKEVYEKLSLLNPSKIAYFAAKLEQLK